MQKKVILLVGISLLLLLGCDKKEKTTVCKKEIKDVNYTITIKKSDKVSVTTEKSEWICMDDNICNNTFESNTEESNKSYNELVRYYRKDGYDCE